MTKTQHRDTVDCLIAELMDAYKAVCFLQNGPEMGLFEPGDVAVFSGRAVASIERALQLVSDLKAAQD